MIIHSVKLASHSLEAQLRFYSHTLNLPVVQSNKSGFTVQAGYTILEFYLADKGSFPFYHFAFNIPPNLFKMAKQWINNSRADLLSNETGDEFRFPFGKGANAFYFTDPGGNILEFIARSEIAHESDFFGPHLLLGISEVGIPVEDVTGTTKKLKKMLGYNSFRRPHSDMAMIGDHRGMLVVVQKGRNWLPTKRGSEVHPLEIVFHGLKNLEYVLDGYPYTFRIEKHRKSA